MRPLPPISTGKSFCNKASIRKHSSSENLSSYHNQFAHLQQQEKPILHSAPSSPSWKSHSSISICVSFIFFFFFITIAAFLHCSNIDPPQIVERSLSAACCQSMESGSLVRNDKPFHAWKGLGTVFVRGTKAMNELVVAHIAENTKTEELRLFLRTSYRSGMAARVDFVFLFASNTLAGSMLHVIYEEYHNFHKFLRLFCDKGRVQNAINRSPLSTTACYSDQIAPSNTSISTFNVNAYRKEESENDTSAQPFWGSHSLSFLQNSNPQNAAVFRWGSVIGFDTAELNADDTLGGFFDHAPVSLRRWPCYQMLLGMVRHRFKHVLLTEVSGVVMLRDPFMSVMRKRAGLYLSMEDRTWASNVAASRANGSTLKAADSAIRRGRTALSSSSKAASRKQSPYVHQRGIGSKRRSRRGAVGGLYERVYGKGMWSALEEFERGKKLVNSGVILGGIHQVRGLANAMVTEIVRVAMERANRETFPDNVLLSYLVHKSSSVLGKRVLDHLHILDNCDSFVHSLIGSQQPSLFAKRTKAAYAMIHGNHKSKRWGYAVLTIHLDICGSPADAGVYMDCAL